MIIKKKPIIPREKFTHAEDLKIAQYYDEFGTDWNKIAENFEGRNGTMIKNRFYSSIRKDNRLQELQNELNSLNESTKAENQITDSIPTKSYGPISSKNSKSEIVSNETIVKTEEFEGIKFGLHDHRIMALMQPGFSNQRLARDLKIEDLSGEHS